MAKKRKKDKEPQEDYQFVPPDFDEKEFLRKEMRDIRTALLTIVFAVVFGAVAGIIAIASPDFALVGLIIVIAGMVALPTIYRFLRVDTSAFQKKNWAGNFGTFFFTFLAIWVMLMNPPFADHAKPTIEEIVVWIDADGVMTGLEYRYLEAINRNAWVEVNKTTEAASIQIDADDTINVTAKVADNGKLALAEIAIGSSGGPYFPMVKKEDSRYEFEVLGNFTGSWYIFMRAVDEAGNERELSTASIPLSY